MCLGSVKYKRVILKVYVVIGGKRTAGYVGGFVLPERFACDEYRMRWNEV